MEEVEELLQLNKVTLGCYEFRQFSDINVPIRNGGNWHAHAHVLESRSEKMKSILQQTTGVERDRCLYRLGGIGYKFLRWLYTDCITFDDDETRILGAAQFHDLPTLEERCQQAIVGKVDITSCAHFHAYAKTYKAATVLKCCNQLISQYYIKSKSLNCSEVDVEFKMEVDNSNSLSEIIVSILKVTRVRFFSMKESRRPSLQNKNKISWFCLSR